MKYKSIQDVVKDLEENPVESGGNIYHPIPFPEFSHLKTSTNKKETIRKLQLVENVLKTLFMDDFNNRKLLDIGANAGLYTYHFSKKGMIVTAFEPHPRYSLIGSFLAREKKLNINWYPTPFDQKKVSGKEFDVALMLSVFQWMANGGENITRAAEELRYVSEISNYLIFEIGFNRGKSCIKTKKINHYAELIELLQKYTRYNYFRLIGKTNSWRGKKRFLVICSNNQDLDDNQFRKLMRRIHI